MERKTERRGNEGLEGMERKHELRRTREIQIEGMVVDWWCMNYDCNASKSAEEKGKLSMDQSIHLKRLPLQHFV